MRDRGPPMRRALTAGSLPFGLWALVALLGPVVAADERRTVTIAPLYVPTVYFTVRSHAQERITVAGRIAGFSARQRTTEETYRQRFVEQQGRFRVIRAVGVADETVEEFGRRISRRRPFADTIRFDALGYFAEAASDPLDLVPLYPGHPVAAGDTWTNDAAVTTALGAGVAHYTFHVDRISDDARGHPLAHVSLTLAAELTPVAALLTSLSAHRLDRRT